MESRDARDCLIARIDNLRTGKLDNSPLTWSDIAFLTRGMAFASSPVSLATGVITDRYNLGPRGTWVLNLIAAGLNHPHELAETLNIGRSLVSFELGKLNTAGLVVSEQSEHDRRRSKLVLTPLGEDAVREVRDGLARLVTGALGKYKPRELRICARILADMQSAAHAM